MGSGGISASDDVDEFHVFFVRLTLGLVDDVHQSWVFGTVPVGPACEGGEATFEPDAVGLEFRAFCVTCQA